MGMGRLETDRERGIPTERVSLVDASVQRRRFRETDHAEDVDGAA